MAKKKSNLCLNRKKGHHYVPKQPHVAHFSHVVSKFKSPRKTPLSNKKRPGNTVFSPYKSPFSKRLRTSTPQKSTSARKCKIPKPLDTLPKDELFLRTHLNSSLIRTGTSGHRESSPLIEHRSQKKISKSLTFSSYGESMLEPCFKEINLEEDITPINHEDDNFTPNDSPQKTQVKYLTELIPQVIEKLQSSGVDSTFIGDFFKEILDETFPLNNISFLLWLEVVQWYKNDCTSAMRYSEDTKKFWKLGWRHFGGRFIRFMSGFKNTSQVLSGEAERGQLKPNKSDINFAVPSVEVLRNYTPYGSSGGERSPGTFVDAIKGVAKALEGSAACISFDGKKLKQGLTPRQGDVDLLGFEKGLSLNERKAELSLRLQKIENIEIEMQKYDTNVNVLHLTDQNISSIRSCLTEFMPIISRNTFKIRDIKIKKEYAIVKFIERGGENWRLGKFAFVVSAIKAFLYDIEKYLKLNSSVFEGICALLSYINKTFFSCQDINVNQMRNYRDILQNKSSDECRGVKQRSDRWFEVRKGAVVTGSTLYKAVGCEGLKKMREHFDSTICKEKSPEFSEVSKNNMQYGTDNEINATSTFVASVLPVIAPSCIYQEEGYIKMFVSDRQYMIISPDGSVLDNDENTISAVEFKCPVSNYHTDVPQRYYLQCQATMHALNVQHMFYVCWRPDITTVFTVYKDEDTFSLAMEIIRDIYCQQTARRPSKLHQSLPLLKNKIENGRLQSKFWGEFPSVKSVTTTVSITEHNPKLVSDVLDLQKNLLETIKDGYHLMREKATEAVVFLCSDLDRSHDRNSLRWAPVNWFPKGYSLSSEIMRNIMENVLNECKQNNLYVPAISFDGQWHNIATRSKENQPLTVLQVMKDVWKEAEKKQKSDIIKEFMSLNKHFYIVKDGHVVTLTNGGKHLPKTPINAPRGKAKKTPNKNTELTVETQVKDIIPESVIENVVELSVDIDTAMIQESHLETLQAQEISDCITDEDTWNRMFDEQMTEGEIHTQTDDVDIHDTFLNQDIDAFSGETTSNNTTHEDSQSNNTESHSNIVLTNEIQIENSPTENERNNTETNIIRKDLDVLLSLLRCDPASNKKGKWDTKSKQDLSLMLLDVQNIQKLLNTELKVIVRFLKTRFKTKQLKESDTKSEKVRKICECLGLLPSGPEANKEKVKQSKRKYTPKKLSDMSKDILSSKKISKNILNIAYAKYIWPERFSLWRKKAPVGQLLNASEKSSWSWFSIPEYSLERKQLEVKSVDATHLFTRLRRHSCRGNIEGASKDAWIRVAKEGNTYLSPLMVEEVSDPMSVIMARTHFSDHIEREMRKNGNILTANFVKDVRNWWIANDDQGISANDRIKLRSSLRERLLEGFDFFNAQFPPPTQYIKGIPLQLWEALLIDIDSKFQLYALTKDGTYNVRAYSSMMGETFFSEVTLQDSRGHGALTCEDFSRYIGQAIEQMHGRLDKERCFAYRTTKTSVYQMLNKDDTNQVPTEKTDSYQDVSCIDEIPSICPRDSWFDLVLNSKDRKGKPKEGTISKDRTAMEKGTLGVRWEKARVNQSKLLVTDRMGLLTV